MPTLRPTRLIVTGHVVFDANFGGCGDIHLYGCDIINPTDLQPEKPARQGRPGYFAASIFDGTDWRKVQLSRLLPYAERAYRSAAQRPRVAEALRQVVLQWRGEVAVYNNESRCFRLGAREML